MKIDRLHTVAFSGHRSYKSSEVRPEELSITIRAAIVELQSQGYNTFLSGMAEGFDMMAAKEVLLLRNEGLCVRLVAVVPFAAQAERFSECNAALYSEILAEADSVTVLSDSYDSQCFHRRNDFLLDNASRLICYYNGSPGGTQYCYKRALRGGLRPINLYNNENPSTGTLF